MKNGPWVIKNTFSKYKSPFVELFEHEVIRPDGKEGIFNVVAFTSSSVVLPIDAEGKVYLSREYRFAIEQPSIEASGGCLEDGETPLQTAQRELREELGIIAKDWVNLGNYHPFTSMVKCTSSLFLARKLTIVEQKLEGTETIELVKMPFSAALEMVMQGKIFHLPTCLLLMKAKEYLPEGF